MEILSGASAHASDTFVTRSGKETESYGKRID